MTRGCGRSCTRVIPSVPSGTYFPGFMLGSPSNEGPEEQSECTRKSQGVSRLPCYSLDLMRCSARGSGVVRLTSGANPAQLLEDVLLMQHQGLQKFVKLYDC